MISRLNGSSQAQVLKVNKTKIYLGCVILIQLVHSFSFNPCSNTLYSVSLTDLLMIFSFIFGGFFQELFCSPGTVVVEMSSLILPLKPG